MARSGFYDWRTRCSRPTTAREREQQLLMAAITVEHIASKGRYGSPRIHAELVDQGWQVGEYRAARVMRVHGLQSRCGRLRRHSLTQARLNAAALPDLVGRDFTAQTPGVKLAGDITYIPTWQGWLYP